MSQKMPRLVAQHHKAGRFIAVRQQKIFVRDEGEGLPIVLVHGVPTSSFLYRKMIPLLSRQGYRAVAFDFPGMGLSEKPRRIDYGWHALATWMRDIVANLALPPVHLVVHDIGGPIALEWALSQPDKVRSITIMNTMIDLPVFKKPFPMWLFSIPFLRQVIFMTQNVPMFMPIMKRVGVYDASMVDRAMMQSYLWLLRHGEGRRPFLNIMAGFDLSPQHATHLTQGIKNLGVPLQVVWGAEDRAIPKTQAEYIIRQWPIQAVHWVVARHFPQEDQAPRCAQLIANFCRKL